MGVPSTPVASRIAISARPPPPRKFHRFVRFAGRIGWPHSSLSSEREGPSARPSAPWHLLHSIASYISLPRLIDSGDDATSFGTSGFFGAPLTVAGANLFR